MRIKTYKLIVEVLSVLLAGTMIFSLVILYKHDIKSQEEKFQLVVENERLRSFNVRRERRLKWMQQPKAIKLEDIALSFNILGTTPSVTAALLYCENGPEFITTGALDKSLYFAQNFPIDKWSTLEGSRTLNRMAWSWILDDPKRSNAFFLYAAKPYTGLSTNEQKTWANNMYLAERRFRTEIVDAGGDTESPLVMTIRTPVPTSSTSTSTKSKKKRNLFVP